MKRTSKNTGRPSGSRDGAEDLSFVVRPIRAEDEPLLLAMHGNLSVEKLRPPCFGAAAVPPRDCLARLGRLDSAQDAGFVADETDAAGTSRLLGVSRYFFDAETGSAELALEVIAPWQSRGLSGHLLEPLIAVARERGVRRLVTGAQAPMMEIATKFGFFMTMRTVGSPGTVEVVRDLEREPT
jgi:GNAT superfamily N-acetyltransferase